MAEMSVDYDASDPSMTIDRYLRENLEEVREKSLGILRRRVAAVIGEENIAKVELWLEGDDPDSFALRVRGDESLIGQIDAANKAGTL